MNDAFSYKRGMRLPARIIKLAGNGLTSLASVDVGSLVFVYRAMGVVERKTIPANIVDAAAMTVEVDFASVNTNTIARYEWQIEATVGALAMAFPERGFYTFSVTATIEV